MRIRGAGAVKREPEAIGEQQVRRIALDSVDDEGANHVTVMRRKAIAPACSQAIEAGEDFIERSRVALVRHEISQGVV